MAASGLVLGAGGVVACHAPLFGHRWDDGSQKHPFKLMLGTLNKLAIVAPDSYFKVNDSQNINQFLIMELRKIR